MTPPAATPAILALHDDLHRERFPNGLTLYVRRDPSAPVATIVTWVDAGYFDESDDVVGIAHVLEHMYFKGTPTRGVGAIARETKAVGGWLNAHTIYDHTAYYTVVPADAWRDALEIQFDAWHRSLIDAGELSRELEVIIQEAARKRDNPSAVTVESLFALLHDAHRIRRWRIGEPDQLRTFTDTAVRDFYRTWYVPSNTIVAVVGDVDVDEVVAAVRARHGELPDRPVPRAATPQESEAPGFRVQELSGDIAHAHVAIGWRAPDASHPDAPLLDLASAILSAGRASRLYRAVRERELATGVSAWHQTAREAGVFLLHGEMPGKTLGEATDAIWREVMALRTDGPTRAEVERAQQVLEARMLRRAETVDGQAMWFAGWASEARLREHAHRGDGARVGDGRDVQHSGHDATGHDVTDERTVAAAYLARLLTATPAEITAALARWTDPAQAAIVAYRPRDAAPLGTDRDAVRARLDAAAVMPSVLAPVVLPEAPALRIAGRPVREHDAHGVVQYRTAGGVPVLVVPRPGATLASIAVLTRGGATTEPADHDGLARLTAHAMLKGTTSRSGEAVAVLAESLGGSIGVSAGLESLGWSLSVPARHLPAAIALLADVVQHPVFLDDAVHTERALALQEAARVRDDMYRWPMRLATSAAHVGHPYARSVLGTPESLPTLTPHAVRAHHAARVLQAAGAIGIAGDGDPDDLAALAVAAFDRLTVGEEAPLPRVTWPAAGTQIFETREKKQTALAMLFPAPARDDDTRFATRVLSAVASGLGGRFFEELRDRQSLAYTVAAFGIERSAGGAFATYIATAPEREAEARAGMHAELRRLVHEPITPEELTRAQRYLVGTHAIGRQSGAAVLAETLDAFLFGTGVHEPHEFAARVQAVTSEDVRALAQRYLDPAFAVEGVIRGTLTDRGA